jgi:predicted flap endonuclease-1-like 5' DNA nuclease
VPSDTIQETSQSIDHTGAVKSTDSSDDDIEVGVDDEGDVIATDAEGDVAVSPVDDDDVAVGVDDAGDVVAADAEGDVAVEDPEGDIAVEDAAGDVAVSMADDLTKIEGIGPEIAAALNAVDIYTYIGLSAADAAALHDVINAAGLHAPLKVIATWPAQAACAAEGDWDGMMAAYKAQ